MDKKLTKLSGSLGISAERREKCRADRTRVVDHARLAGEIENPPTPVRQAKKSKTMPDHVRSVPYASGVRHPNKKLISPTIPARLASIRNTAGWVRHLSKTM